MANRLYRTYRRAFFHVYGWATLRLYDELAWAYDPISQFVSAGRWAAWRSLALDYVCGPHVLELGFGTGELLLAMRAQGLQAVGLDLSKAMHRVTAAKFVRRGLTVPRVRGLAEALPFASGRFDTVLSTFPAGYIFEADTLREVARVLAPGGRLVIGGLTVELPRSPKYLLSVIPNGPWDRIWSYVQARAAAAGLTCTVMWHEDGPARIPIIVCTSAVRGSANPEGA